MSKFLDEEYIYQLWTDQLLSYTADIQALGDQYPEKKSLELSFTDITLEPLQSALVDQPELCINIGEQIIQSMLSIDQKAYLNLRLNKLWSVTRTRLRDIRADKLGKFISIEVEIKRVSDVRPRVVLGVFRCTSCGFKQEVVQDAYHFTDPLECNKDDGGCGKKKGSTTFKFLVNESMFIDSQTLLVQELREDLRGTQQPQTLEVHLEDDLCGVLDGAEVVIINGIIKGKQNKESSVFDIYMTGNNIEFDIRGYSVEFTQEEIDDIVLKLGDNPMEMLALSFAPAIKGMFRIKQAFVLQQVGGTGKTVSGQKKRRKDIFIGLIGDPGTAKSSIGEFACLLQPGSVVVDGINPSGPGLTAAAVKSEFDDGRFSLEPGALVLAHNKLFMWDEMHLAKPEVVGVLNRPMENLEFGIAKGGIVASYKTEFGGIFIANPIHGRFTEDDLTRPLVECIDTKRFTEPLRDRIDYWARIVDDKNEQKSKDMAMHVLADDRGEIEPPLSMTELMKYFQYCRTKFKPRIPHSLDADITEKFSLQRNLGNMYTRDLFTIIRFAEANAKVHRRTEVMAEDVDLAFTIVNESLRTATADGMGKMDRDAIHVGMGYNKRQQAEVILEIVKELSDANDWKGAGELEIRQECEARSISDWEGLLRVMNDRGYLIKTRQGLWKVIK